MLVDVAVAAAHVMDAGSAPFGEIRYVRAYDLCEEINSCDCGGQRPSYSGQKSRTQRPVNHDDSVCGRIEGEQGKDGEGVLTATATPDATRELVATGRICAIGKYVGLGYMPWGGVTGPTHWRHLTRATFAADMSTFSYLNLIYLFYSYTNLASVSRLGNLSGVRSTRYTFSSCAFATIDFRGFDPSHLADLFYTFSWRNKLTTIYADSTWTLPSSGITGSQCFCSCSTSLVGGNGTVWARNLTAYTYLRIDSTSTPGYITVA